MKRSTTKIQKRIEPLSHKQMVAKMLKKPTVKAKLTKFNQEELFILDEILAARKTAGLSQAQVAKKMGTKASSIARLESSLASGKHSPSLSTLKKYAAALGKRVQIHFI